jgi:hypothetical protein
MASLILSGSTSGSVTLESPAVSGTTTLTLPTTSGTVLTNGTNTNFPAGSVLQVVQVSYNTEFSTTSSTFADTGLTASITPSSSSNKILVLYSVGYLMQDTNIAGLRLLRGETVLQTSVRAAHALHASYFHNEYLDSPATTSSTTYKVQSNKNTGSAFATSWNAEQPSTITLMEIKG